MQPLPFKAKRQAVEGRRQQDGSMEAVEERGASSFTHPLKVPRQPPALSSLPPEDLIQRLT